ncbi:MAG: PTS sugar transporter subunit IIA [Halieaceae bacterium]
MLQLDQLLSPARTLCAAPGASKKRLFETAAEFICADQQQLESKEIYSKLLARERLGSTALGEGIAIPHCRISHCERAVGTLITLEQGIDFDSPDGRPVDLLFLLLVPEEEQQEHLNILAGLAQLLSEAGFCAALRNASSNEELYRAAVGFQL